MLERGGFSNRMVDLAAVVGVELAEDALDLLSIMTEREGDELPTRPHHRSQAQDPVCTL